MTDIVQFNPEDYSALVERWLKAEQNGEKFPVDFDVAWKIAGYASKASAKRKITNLSMLKQNKDYSIILQNTGEIRGRPLEYISMTTKAFLVFCLFSGNENIIQSAIVHFLSQGEIAMDWAKPSEKDKSGFVYLVKQSYTSYYKIGCSKKPYQRLQTLQTGNPLEIQIIERVFSLDCFALEKALHEYYDAYRIRGEWFDLTKELVNEFYVVAHDLDKTREEQTICLNVVDA